MITLSLPQLPVKDDLSGRVQTNFDLTTIAFNRLQSGIDGLQTSVAAFSLANAIIKNPGTSARNTIKSSATDATTLTLTALVSQTANLQEWQNSSGTVKISVTPAGNLGIGVTPVYGLDAETVVGSTVAKFGASTPLYIRASDPGLGFNAYYNSGWKFGKGSSANYAANFDFDPSTGNLVYSATSASGNADAAATMATLFTISRGGNHIFSPTAFKIIADTVDGSDSKSFYLGGGGGADNSRGATILLSGNESVGTGILQLVPGNNSGGSVQIFMNPNQGAAFGMADTGAVVYLTIDTLTGSELFVLWQNVSLSKNLSITGTLNPIGGLVSTVGGGYEEGTFTATLTGVTATITGTARFIRIGKMVILDLPQLLGTSNTTACTITGLPSSLWIRALSTQYFPVPFVQDNTTNYQGFVTLTAGSGTIALGFWTTSISSGSTFTNINTKGLSAETSIAYQLN